MRAKKGNKREKRKKKRKNKVDFSEGFLFFLSLSLSRVIGFLLVLCDEQINQMNEQQEGERGKEGCTKR